MPRFSKRKKMEQKKQYSYDYPRPAMTTDCVVFGFDGQDLRILLIQRGVEPYKGRWAFPGGFIRENETAEACARRELKEETNLDVTNLKQLRLYSDVHRDPRGRVITMAFYALVKSSTVTGGDDAILARWFPIDHVPDLAFDHGIILEYALHQLKKDIHFEPIGFELLDKTFTIPQLQRLYEVILGVNFDRRNFHKKMLQLGLIEEVEEPTDEWGLMQKNAVPTFFGERKQMKAMDIDQLFGASTPMQMSTRGRKPKLFHFIKKKYDDLKNDDTFKVEF